MLDAECLEEEGGSVEPSRHFLAASLSEAAMSLTKVPADVLKFARCWFDDDPGKCSHHYDDTESDKSSREVGSPGHILFGACREEHELPTACLSLDFDRAAFFADMSQTGVLSSADEWFNDEVINLAMGCLWAGLLPKFSLSSTPDSSPPPAARQQVMLLSTYIWSKATDLATATMPEEVGAGRKTRKKSASRSPGGRGNSAMERRGIRRAQSSARDADSGVVFLAKEESPSVSDNVTMQSEALNSVCQKMLSNLFRAAKIAPGKSWSADHHGSLLHAARDLEIDILTLPGFVESNHWIGVSFVGLRSLADMVLQGDETRDADSKDCEAGVDSSTTAKPRVIVLDSMNAARAQGAESSGKFTPSRKTKATRRLHRVANVVLHILANNWVRSTACVEDVSNPDNFLKVLQDKVTWLSDRVVISNPPVPKQKDKNQCGPMAILAMEAFCHDESFRRSCIEWGDGAGDTGTDALNESALESYTFEDSFRLRCRLLRVVEDARSVARARVVAIKEHA